MAGFLKTQRIVLGIPELDKALQELKISVANRVARAGLSAGIRLAVKQIKREIPSGQKHLRKAIGGYVKQVKSGPNKGFTAAKGGAAVGKKRSARLAEARQLKAERMASGKPGVGITANNIHWWILGTKERTQKTTGRNVGAMPAHPVVREATEKSRGAIFSTIKTRAREQLNRERAKIATRNKARLAGQRRGN